MKNQILQQEIMKNKKTGHSYECPVFLFISLKEKMAKFLVKVINVLGVKISA